MKKYIISLLLLAGIVSSVVMVSPMYAMDEEEQKKGADTGVWNGVQGFTDFIMDTVGAYPAGGKWLQQLQHKYKLHRYGVPYQKLDYFLYNATFAAGTVLRDAQGKEFNDTDNVLKIIRQVRPMYNGTLRSYGATREGDFVYTLVTDNEGNVTGCDGIFGSSVRADLVLTFVHNRMLYKKDWEDIVMNKLGHRLETRNGRPLLGFFDENNKTIGLLVFKVEGQESYCDEDGIKLADTTEKLLDRFPTIDFVPHPDAAVSAVLAGVAVTGVGIGSLALKALKWGYKKAFGADQKDKNGESNKKDASSNSSTDADKNAEPAKQESVQPEPEEEEEVQQFQELESGQPVIARSEESVQPNACIDTKFGTVVPERPIRAA